MRLVGIPDINFNTSATSAWGNNRMRVAMVLDNTGSMASDGKMPAMQTAAKSLIDQLSALAKDPGDMYISVVPFAKDVNFGTSYANQTYMDCHLGRQCQWDLQQHQLHDQEILPRRRQDLDAGADADHSKWTGCVTDRAQDYDTKNTIPTAGNAPTMVVPEEYVSGSTKYCKTGSSSYLQPIVPLSYNWSTLKTSITNMQPTGNTNQGIGLAWGWLTLGTGAPFSAPAKDTANYTYKEAIVLLSDGLNTENRFGTPTLRRLTPGRRSCATTPRRPTSRSIPFKLIPAGIQLPRCCNTAPAAPTSSSRSSKPTRPCRCSIRSDSRWPSCASRNSRRNQAQEKEPGRNGRAQGTGASDESAPLSEFCEHNARYTQVAFSMAARVIRTFG